MSIIELIRKAVDADSLNDAEYYAHETAYDNYHLKPRDADLSPFTGNNNSQGITGKEAAGLFLALTELTLNVKRGLGITPTDEDNETTTKVNQALSKAREFHPQPEIICGIILDTQTRRGEVFTTHPVVPGFSPEHFDLQAAKIRRSKERDGTGGINHIEVGFIHKLMDNAELSHSQVQTQDIEVAPGAKVRKVWVEFQRKP